MSHVIVATRNGSSFSLFFSLMAFSGQTLLALQAASFYPGRRSRDARGPPWLRFGGRDRTPGFSPANCYIVQRGLENRTRKTERHSKTKLFAVHILNGRDS